MAGSDWIKLHRKSLDSQVFSDDFLWRLWCWCLMRASWTERYYRGEKLLAGQFATGRKAGANDLGCSESKWYRGIKRLEELGQITIEVNSKWTTLSVCNWGTYQNDADESEQQMNSQRTASEQLVNTIKEGKENKEGKERESDGVFFVFPVKGGGTWEMTWSEAKTLKAAYPNISIKAECNKAYAWLCANEGKQKTVRGMMRFLNAWISRAEPTKQEAPVRTGADLKAETERAKEARRQMYEQRKRQQEVVA